MIWVGRKTSEQKSKERLERKTKWHKWFAWHPVTVGEENHRHKKAWLCSVYRKCTRVTGYEDWWWYKEYSISLPDVMVDVLKNEK